MTTTTHDITEFIFEEVIKFAGTELLKLELKGRNEDYEKGIQEMVLVVHAILSQVELYMHLQQLERLNEISAKETVH